MKNKTNLILTIVLSIIAVGALVFGGIMIKNHYTSKSDGQIQVKLVNLENVTISDKTIDFKKGDTLVYLVQNNYENVVIQNGMIMSIESFTTADDWSTFISIYVDGEMSLVGINDISFENGTIISFVMTEFIYSSINEK